MTRRAPRRKQEGIALLMVLMALAILGAMTADLMESSEVYLSTTTNARDSVRAEYMARSGVNLSRLLLSFQRMIGSSGMNFPFWQYADLAIGLFTDSEGGLLGDLGEMDTSANKGVGLEGGEVSIKIIDEDSKLNINVAADQGRTNLSAALVSKLRGLMAPIQFDPLFERASDLGAFFQRDEVICEIVDYVDGDENLCDGSGGEDKSFYQSLDPPRERKNAPLDSLEELRLIKGMSDDLWATFVDPNPEDPDSRIMTVWGKGMINVNTAPAGALLSVLCMPGDVTSGDVGFSPCTDELQVMGLAQILQLVLQIRTIMPFNSVNDFLGAIENPGSLLGGLLGIDLPGFTLPNKGMARRMLTTKSTVFSIYANGTVGNVTKRLHVVVDMAGQDMLDPTKSVGSSGGSVLYWRMD
jgi:general secretion pathway protein K